MASIGDFLRHLFMWLSHKESHVGIQSQANQTPMQKHQKAALAYAKSKWFFPGDKRKKARMDETWEALTSEQQNYILARVTYARWDKDHGEIRIHVAESSYKDSMNYLSPRYSLQYMKALGAGETLR